MKSRVGRFVVADLPRRARCWGASLAVLLICFSAIRLKAQQTQPDTNAGFEGQPVTSVVIAAASSVDLNAMRQLIKQQSGQPFSNDALRESVQALQQTQKFSQVQVSIDPEQNGIRVLFILQPADYVGTIEFPGIGTRLPYTQLLQSVSIPQQTAYFPELLEAGKNNLLNYLHKNGYFAAEVQPEIQRDEPHRVVNLIFRCTLKKQARIRDIKLSGMSERESADLQKALKGIWAMLKAESLKPGQKYSQQRVDKSIAFMRAHLRSNTRLAPVIKLSATNYDASTNRVDVVLDVTPGLRVSVRVSGAHVSRRMLRKLVPVYEEDAADQDLIEEGKRNLTAYFQTKGYFDVTVDSHTDHQGGAVNIAYEVSRGSKHRLSGVYFDGNEYFSDKQLREHVSVEKGLFFLHGSYSEQLVSKSVAALIGLYKDEGFESVSIEPKVEDFNPEVVVTFEIKEGPRDTVAALDVTGNKTQPLSALEHKNALRLKPGKPFSPKFQELDRTDLLAAYLDRGYLNAAVRSSATPTPEDPHKINVTFAVEEGPHTNISDVVFLGEKHTRPKLIEKVAETSVKPGQSLSEGESLQAESDLYNLGIFDWVNVNALRPIVDQSTEELLIKVHESALNTMDIGLGLEIIPRDGNVPTNSVVVPGIPPISLGNKFTVSQKSYVGPRVEFDFSRHNLWGSAQTGTIGTIVSRLDQRVFANYSDPRFIGSSWSSLLSVSAERTTENPIYTAEEGLASLQFQKALNKKRTKNLILRYSFQRIDLYNIIIPNLVLPSDQRVRLSTFDVEYTRDTRDKPLDAHHGVYQTFDFGVTSKAFGASDDFLRFLGQTAFYFPVKPWLVWANNFRLGLAEPFNGSEVPLAERFFSGGADSLRGYPINGAGPQRPVPVCSNPSDPSTCTLISVPVGGDMLFIFNSEARFPLPIYHGLGGVIFYDGGNVYSSINLRQFADQFTHSVGIGLRYQTPVGPIRFDVGYRITSVPGVNAAQYFVTVGQSF